MARRRIKPMPAPDVTVHVTIVEIGYQIDVYIDGKPAGSVCRDFGGDWDIEYMKGLAAASMIQAMADLEKHARRLRGKRAKLTNTPTSA